MLSLSRSQASAELREGNNYVYGVTGGGDAGEVMLIWVLEDFAVGEKVGRTFQVEGKHEQRNAGR